MGLLHRIGDTLRIVSIYEDDTGNPVNLTTTDITPSAVVRNASGSFVRELIATVSDQSLLPGRYILVDDTSNYPAEDLSFFEIYTGNAEGVVSSTSPVIMTFDHEILTGDPIDDIGAIQAIAADLLNNPDDFKVTLSPNANVKLDRIVDPGSRFRMTIDFSNMLAGRTMVGLEYWAWDDKAGTLGWRTGDASNQPRYDNDHALVEIYCYCDPAFQNNPQLKAGIIGELSARIRFSDGQAEEAAVQIQLVDR